MNPPQTQEYPIWYKSYIEQIKTNIMEVLEEQVSTVPTFINSIPIDKGSYAYAPGKWTIKQLLGHVIDTERIMVYRLTCFARGEQEALPGFDENAYVAHAHFDDRTLQSLAEELSTLRKANLFLIKSFNEDELNKIGNANGSNISVRALVFILAGHVAHHINIIKERYL